MIISVHLPKTGGSSFKTLLQEQYGQQMLLDYDDKPMSHNKLSRNWAAIMHNFRARPLENIHCIHGHFLPYKYAYLNQESDYVIWLRDPAERIVSHYYYWQRTSNKIQKPPLHHKLTNKELSLEQFCRLPRFWNFYHQYLFRFKLENFSFIGLIENYEQSLTLFCKQFHIEKPVSVLFENQNSSRSGKTYDICPSLRHYIEKKNQKDYQLYYQAQRLHEALLNKFNP
jgi:hypothetical protein